MIKNVIIVTAETNINYSVYDTNTTAFIGVERGCLNLIEHGILIDLAIADFDKVNAEELDLIKNKSKELIKLNNEKDNLDGEMAILEAIKINPSNNIVFIANPTKRYDKNISIFNLIFKYDIKFINDNTFMFLMKKGDNQISYNNYQDIKYISFYAKTQTKITIKNMKYETNKLEFSQYENSCISNEFIKYQDPKITNDEDIICIMTK